MQDFGTLLCFIGLFITAIAVILLLLGIFKKRPATRVKAYKLFGAAALLVISGVVIVGVYHDPNSASNTRTQREEQQEEKQVAQKEEAREIKLKPKNEAKKEEKQAPESKKEEKTEIKVDSNQESTAKINNLEKLIPLAKAKMLNEEQIKNIAVILDKIGYDLNDLGDIITTDGAGGQVVFSSKVSKKYLEKMYDPESFGQSTTLAIQFFLDKKVRYIETYSACCYAEKDGLVSMCKIEDTFFTKDDAEKVRNKAYEYINNQPRFKAENYELASDLSMPKISGSNAGVLENGKFIKEAKWIIKPIKVVQKYYGGQNEANFSVEVETKNGEVIPNGITLKGVNGEIFRDR